MKFVHCADIHLDSPMVGLARYEGAPVERLRGATRRAFERLVGFAIEEQAAFVVIAGDLYDGERDDFHTAMFLQRQLHALCDNGIPVVIAYGNHDAANEITKRLDFPDDVHVFPHDRAGSVELEKAEAVLHGQSYANRAVREDLSLGYPRPVPGLLNIGVLHTALEGRPGHDPYAPCTLDELVDKGYAYWALGHVHQREHHVKNGAHIVFPGNLQGRDMGETGPKGATLVEYNEGKVLSVTERDLAPVRWTRLEPDLRNASSVERVLETVIMELNRLQQSSDAEFHAVRIIVNCTPTVMNEWLRASERYEAQLRSDAAGDDEALWIERIELRPGKQWQNSVPGEALDAVREAFGSLRSGKDPMERSKMGDLLSGLRSRFGPELKDVVRLGAAVVDEGALDQLLDEAEALLLAELEKGA